MPRPAPTALTINDRLIVTAALDRIFYDDPLRFPVEDARAVRRIIPPARSAWFSLGFRSETRERPVKGQAAGVGTVEMDGGRTVREGSIGEGAAWRCGQYRISNYGDGLEVWQVMSEAFDETPKGARLEYTPAGRPTRLLFFRPRDLLVRLPFTRLELGVRLGSWGAWKRAA